jgi:aspartyl-tRNA synthetase
MVTLNGWVHSRRDLGGVIFIDLRDRYGKTQIVFNPLSNPDAHTRAKELRSEYVISVTGRVERRPEGGANADLETGAVDVMGSDITILNKAETPPFPIDESVDAGEDLRLKFRYLDLRRPALQRTLMIRHRMYKITHDYFDARGFIEIETPVLMKSTPEGARDYLVPSRVHKGKFYALPQSPQTYKQILMIAGFDRYVQIVKCFRDEDLRADRQPEFTQIDVEMSFIDEADIQTVSEGLIAAMFKEIKAIDIPLPLPRLTYKEAIEQYGSDKPDTRFGMPLRCINDLVKGSGFKVFADVAARQGIVAGFVVPGAASFTRSQLDNLVDYTKSLGAGGLVYFKWTDAGIETAVEKFLGKEPVRTIAAEMGARKGDLVLLVADTWSRAYTVLGALRLEMGKRMNSIDETKNALLWVTDFPMFEFSQEELPAFLDPEPGVLGFLEFNA